MKTNTDDHPERFMSHPLVAGIDIGIQYVCRAARARKPRERDAMMWLTRYANLLDVTADSMAATLGMSPESIRLSLTWPEADMSEFVRAVEALRAAFEAPLNIAGPAPREQNPFHERSPWFEAYGQPAKTLVFDRARAAVRMALAGPEIVEINGLERLGKTTAMRHFFLKNLHKSGWVESPVGHTEQEWLRAVATGLGVGNGTYYKGPQLRHKIENALGPNKIEILFIDSTQRLLPKDLRKSPDRLEELYRMRDHYGVSIVLGVTPQFAAMVNEMVSLADEGKSFYRPGQWIGRRQPFDLPDTLEDTDLALIARWHEPALDSAGVEQLIQIAHNNPGYIGTMVKTIKRARAMTKGERVTGEHLDKALKQVNREKRLLENQRAKTPVLTLARRAA